MFHANESKMLFLYKFNDGDHNEPVQKSQQSFFYVGDEKCSKRAGSGYINIVIY